ncbi:hypothetical protein IU427_17790 [Nocardia beijingensis]|uniref:hypothetical protein n=1 Tax=Nocardia beijingensis TaxID=95162 RepID=UPI0018933526|nr:hypothetical protein [Nocardia beijingensis]MBF6467019.1 hypothetical protein [Nocardia beijingensis]
MNTPKDEAPPDSVPMPDFTTVVDWHGQPDTSLQDIVRFSHITAPNLTLYLPWGIAAGSVVSGQQFFTNAAKLMRSGTASFDSEEFAKQIDSKVWADKWAKILFDSHADSYAQDGDNYFDDRLHQGHGTISFIHLRNAKCWFGGRVIQHEFIRIQLSHVTGWAYGAIME